ncbi:MAG: hypothetical protein ACK5IR_15415 [Tropicimonas sp.]
MSSNLIARSRKLIFGAILRDRFGGPFLCRGHARTGSRRIEDIAFGLIKTAYEMCVNGRAGCRRDD